MVHYTERACGYSYRNSYNEVVMLKDTLSSQVEIIAIKVIEACFQTVSFELFITEWLYATYHSLLKLSITLFGV